jgi:hypothetical protein
LSDEEFVPLQKGGPFELSLDSSEHLDRKHSQSLDSDSDRGSFHWRRVSKVKESDRAGLAPRRRYRATPYPSLKLRPLSPATEPPPLQFLEPTVPTGPLRRRRDRVDGAGPPGLTHATKATKFGISAGLVAGTIGGAILAAVKFGAIVGIVGAIGAAGPLGIGIAVAAAVAIALAGGAGGALVGAELGGIASRIDGKRPGPSVVIEVEAPPEIRVDPGTLSDDRVVALRPKVSRADRPMLAQGCRGEAFHKGTKLRSKEVFAAPFRAAGATAYSTVRHPKRTVQRAVPLARGSAARRLGRILRKPLEWGNLLAAQPAGIEIETKREEGDPETARRYLKYHAAMMIAYVDGTAFRNPEEAVTFNSSDNFGTPAYLAERRWLKEIHVKHGDRYSWRFQTIADGSRNQIAKDLYECLPDEIRHNLNKRGFYEDPRTNNRIALRLETKSQPPELVIAYRGMLDGSAVAGHLKNLAGGVPPSVEQAIAFSKYVHEAVRNYNEATGSNIQVVDVGHSGGGMLA